MRRAGVGIGLACFLFAAAVLVFGQNQEGAHHNGKAGLWEITTTTTWQKAPPRLGSPGMPPPGGSHTTSVCLSQAMVDAGALLPQSRGQCRIQNKEIKPGSMTADYVCTGKQKGIGKLVTTIVDPEHITGSIHFEGTVDSERRPLPIEWTAISNSVFKTAECGNGAASVPAASAPATSPH